MLPMLDAEHDLPLCRPITRQLVGDHDAGWPHLLLQQFPKQPPGSLLVAPALDQYVEDHPGLVDRTLEPALHTGNFDGHLIKVPLVSDTWQPPPDPIGECLAELERPLPYGLVADDDAAGGQHLLDHAQAEREAEIQPDRMADDLSWE